MVIMTYLLLILNCFELGDMEILGYFVIKFRAKN